MKIRETYLHNQTTPKGRVFTNSLEAISLGCEKSTNELLAAIALC